MDKIVRTIGLIRGQIKRFNVPSVTKFSKYRNPYLVLISCVLSLRTKDKTTVEASKRLFRLASSPRAMLKLSVAKISKTIYPVGFYRNKARTIWQASKKIITEYRGKVPRTLEELLNLKGVGRKTANLVLGLGYNIPAICVDVHVHRISNRLGWVKTRSPEETEYALNRIVPRRLWIDLNTILVTFGQNICLPVSPYCSKCIVTILCKKNSVTKRR